MVGRESDGSRVVREIDETKRRGLVDEHAEDAPARRQIAQLLALLVTHPGRDEAADASVRAEHTERAVRRARDARRRLDDRSQRLVQDRGHGDGRASLHDLSELVLLCGGGHGWTRPYTHCGFPVARTRAPADGLAAARADTVSMKGIRKPRRGRILLAYDGTPSARRALQRAAHDPPRGRRGCRDPRARPRGG